MKAKKQRFFAFMMSKNKGAKAKNRLFKDFFKTGVRSGYNMEDIGSFMANFACNMLYFVVKYIR